MADMLNPTEEPLREPAHPHPHLPLRIAPGRRDRRRPIGDFLAITGGCVGLGAGLGAAAIWIIEQDPRWDRGVGYGSLLGLLIGLALALVDAGAGG